MGVVTCQIIPQSSGAVNFSLQATPARESERGWRDPSSPFSVGAAADIRHDIAQLRAELQTNFRWTIGFLVGTWITIMLTLLFRP